MSRLGLTVKNVRYGLFAKLLSLLIGFLSRTIFIYTLGINYLGVNGLFTNILGVLSLAELGIGTAINYSLYKPIAENDIETIKSLMIFYKKTYQVIALVITFLGLSLLPFLGIIVKNPGDVGNISVYYLIFLFNTVSSYFVSYKFSLVNANQQNYIFSLVNSITSFLTISIQIFVLLMFKSFLIYLLTASVIGLAQKVFLHFFIDRKFPYLMEKNVQPLPKQVLDPVKKNIKALFFHKIGDVGVHQTDNIIISSFINVSTVGLLSNYNLLITSISGILTIIFNSTVASFGNLIATESKEKQFAIYRIYRFIAFWLYGFSAIALYVLSDIFITLWIGASMVIPQSTVLLIIIDFYMIGHRITINNIKSAGGIFQQDAYVAILQTVVNLVVSIILVRKIGLPGVFIGTICQGLLSTIIKPIIVYRVVFQKPSWLYFRSGLIYACAVVFSGFVCVVLKNMIVSSITPARFLAMCFCTAIIPNVIFFLLFRNSIEFKEILKIVKKGRIKGRR